MQIGVPIHFTDSILGIKNGAELTVLIFSFLDWLQLVDLFRTDMDDINEHALRSILDIERLMI